MTDEKIIDLLDITHPSGLGRGGFLYKLHSMDGLIYDDNDTMIMSEFSCEYVNPIGPFKRWVVLHTCVLTKSHNYSLIIKEEFWGALSETEAISRFIRPFLHVMRRFSNDQITESDLYSIAGGKYHPCKEALDPDGSQYFFNCIRRIKNSASPK